MLMMMSTITVHLYPALDMGSGYDDAATRAAAVSQSRYSGFSMLRHSLTISDFILGHITRAEYPSHINGPYQPASLRSISTQHQSLRS
jgi:hypothetical protein